MARDKDNINHLVIVSDKSDKLTSKQEHFCQLVAEGQMLTEAYRKAYNVGESTKPSTVWTNASNLAVKNTKVALRIKELTEEITARNRTKEDQLKIWVTEKLKSEAVSAETDSARISALVALGKSVAMFTDNVHQETKETERTAQDIEADLQRRLAALMGE
jgi:hypothetical protein